MKADGEKSRSYGPQPVQRSTTLTVTSFPSSNESHSEHEMETSKKRRTGGIDLMIADGIIIRIDTVVTTARK